LGGACVDRDRRPGLLDDWIADLLEVDDPGALALSVATQWPQVHLFDTVLMADLGVDGYNGLWRGETDCSSPEITTALEHFQTLMGFTNTDRDGLDWPDSTQMV